MYTTPETLNFADEPFRIDIEKKCHTMGKCRFGRCLKLLSNESRSYLTCNSNVNAKLLAGSYKLLRRLQASSGLKLNIIVYRAQLFCFLRFGHMDKHHQH